MVSALTNRGRLAFMLFDGKFNTPLFLNFLRRLLRVAKRQVSLIVDRHSVHKAAKVVAWLETNAERIRIFYLPAYSPQLNPDELVNQDVKTNAIGRRRARDKVELKADLRAYLKSTQRQPDVVQSYFLQDDVLYAAW
jgi:transposase